MSNWNHFAQMSFIFFVKNPPVQINFNAEVEIAEFRKILYYDSFLENAPYLKDFTGVSLETLNNRTPLPRGHSDLQVTF